MSSERRVVRVRITGRVQGVYYRAWTKSEAERLGLGGWVRNEYDGSVAALLSGAHAAIEEMLRLMRDGPLDARVAEVLIEEADSDEAPKGFDVLR